MGPGEAEGEAEMPSCNNHDDMAGLTYAWTGMLGSWVSHSLRDEDLPTRISLVVTRYIRVRAFVERRDPLGTSSPGREAEGASEVDGRHAGRGEP